MQILKVIEEIEKHRERLFETHQIDFSVKGKYITIDISKNVKTSKQFLLSDIQSITTFLESIH